MTYLLILTIGPVQSYISQARRTQDLLQGSRILSHLAEAGVAVAEKHPQATLIYPKLQIDPQEEIAGTPNRIVVRVNSEDEGTARTLASDMSAAIHQCWQAVSESAFTYFGSYLPDNKSRANVAAIWNRQVEEWLEVYWIVYKMQSNSYPDEIDAASAALASRKMLRNFKPITEYGRKCSITGEHEALHDDNSYTDFWDSVRDAQDNESLIGTHERLSAIATIKRIIHERVRRVPIYPPLKIDRRFPSTSSMAAIPFKYDVLKTIAFNPKVTALETAVKNYVNALLPMFGATEEEQKRNLFFNIGQSWNPEYFGYLQNTLPKDLLNQEWVQEFRSIDGDFLFEDTLISTTIEEYSGEKPKAKDLKAAKEALKHLVDTARKFDIAPPQPYYVILSMDGDNMGKLLGCIKSPDDHTNFSDALARYAQGKVIDIVQNQHLGRVVYAGGDDVMALLPVRDALTVANKLRQAFADAVKDAAIENREGNPLTATASTGLAFVHHTHNLQQAVREANLAQGDAKTSQKRNALSVRLLRRSGERRQMQHNWEVAGADITVRILTLVQEFADNLGRSLPYDVSQIRYAMASPKMPSAAIEAELTRVIKRRLPQGDKEKAASIAANILAITYNKELRSLDEQWGNTLRWLELARFIAQSTRQEISE